MNEHVEEHLEGYRQAVNNNQLYLAMQHLLEVVNGVVDEVYNNEDVSEPEPEPAPKETRKKTSTAKSKSTSAKKSSSTKKDEDDSVSN